MQGIILVAEEGKESVNAGLPPKCLKLIDGTTLIEKQIQALVGVGCNRIVIVVGYKGEEIIKHIVNGKYRGIKFIHNNDFETTGTMYSFGLAKNILNDKIFLLVNSFININKSVFDGIISIDYPNVMVYNTERIWHDTTTVVSKVVFDSQHHITSIGKHISNDGMSGYVVGLYSFSAVFKDELVAFIDRWINSHSHKTPIEHAIREVGLHMPLLAYEME